MHTPIITIMLKALGKSSRFLYRDYFELELQQSSKGSKNDFVGKSYNKCEEILNSELAKYGNHLRFKTIPIDGIENFAHAIPFFSVVIVAYNNDEPVAVITDFPIISETYYATKGGGMWLERHNNSSTVNSSMRLRVSSRKENSIFISDTPYKEDSNYQIRNFGCNAYAISMIAAGKADLVHISTSTPILLSAAYLFMQESGGKIISDNPLILSNGYSNIPELI